MTTANENGSIGSVQVSHVLHLPQQNGIVAIAKDRNPLRSEEESGSLRLWAYTTDGIKYTPCSLTIRTRGCSLWFTRGCFSSICNLLPCLFHCNCPFGIASLFLFITGNGVSYCCLPVVPPLLHRTMKFKNTIYNVQNGYMHMLGCRKR